MYICDVKLTAVLRPEVENKKFRLAAKSMYLSAEPASLHGRMPDDLCFLEGFVGNSCVRVAGENGPSR